MPATDVTRVGDPDALASLEDRIFRAVQLVTKLRSDSQAAEAKAASALAERESAVSAMDELRNENAMLQEEIKELREERDAVRSRIEKLLGQLDSLAS
jgi:uncharacterized coiled-coil DUF342 family protein